jgi:hypothetical protein
MPQSSLIHREPFIRQQPSLSGPGEHLGNICRLQYSRQRALPVRAENRGVPDRVIHVQVHKSIKQEAVDELFHRQPLTAGRREDLEPQRQQPPFRHNWGLAGVAVQHIKLGRQLLQHGLNQYLLHAQRLCSGHALRQGHVTEHGCSVGVISEHRLAARHVCGYHCIMGTLGGAGDWRTRREACT